MTRLLLLLTAFLLLSLSGVAQSVSGRITNEFGEPVPFANVYVKELATGTISDDEGRYVVNFSLDGEYQFVFSSLGYASHTLTLVVGTEGLTQDVRLLSSEVELEEITVTAAGRDPAYGIIREAIARKDDYLRASGNYRTRIYVKAVEEVKRHERPKDTAPARRDPTAPGAEPNGPEDPFSAEERAARALLDGLNMVELQLTLNHAYPHRYKEERTAYQTYGDHRGLFLPNFTETDFNFYRNLVRLPGISDAPVISPLSNTSVLTYKFELEGTDLEDGQNVYRIRVTPRKTGNSTVAGVLHINADSYTINRFDFRFPEGGLRFADEFALEQAYAPVADGRWIVNKQVFRYATRQGRKKTFRGTTTLSYTDYEADVDFPAKFFGNEVAVTTSEAYERDSSYWAAGRTVELSPEEHRMVALRDSLRAVSSTRAYQDSIQALYNRVTLMELAFDGVGFRNNRKKSHLYFGPVSSLIDFSPVGGWRVGPYVSTLRRFPSGRVFSASGSASMGVKNLDLQGNFSTWFRYDPFRLGDLSISGGRSFESFNPNDAYLNQLKASNYYLRDAVRIGQRIELFNGLFVSSSFDLSNRQPITGYETSSLLDGVVEDEGDVVDFAGYQAFVTTAALFYTPGQKYMREPNRKVVLGSKWPTFSLLHRRGWSGPLSSDVNFDYLQFALEQEVMFGALGNSRYRAEVGRFVNTQDLRFVDLKRFRDSDPVLYSDPLTSFQALDAALSTTDLFLEFHHIHHFNGALINNVPLLKKTRVKAVAGGGMLWLRDGNYRHQELFAGLERVFKLGARRRLRVGLYGVAADATGSRPTTAYKVSFDLIDIWKKDWSF